MKNPLIAFMVIAAFSVSACDDNAAEPPIDQTENTPVIANTANTFTYTVRARDFTAGNFGALTFTSDSLTVALTSSEYAAGSAYVTVRDSFDTVIFTDTVRSNKVTALANAKATRPKSYAINIAGLTGTLVFVVVGQ